MSSLDKILPPPLTKSMNEQNTFVSNVNMLVFEQSDG